MIRSLEEAANHFLRRCNNKEIRNILEYETYHALVYFFITNKSTVTKLVPPE